MKGTLILLNKWDLRYLKLAEEVSSWSKDPSSKIGAIAVGNKGQVLAQGYNGFPRGVIDKPEYLIAHLITNAFCILLYYGQHLTLSHVLFRIHQFRTSDL